MADDTWGGGAGRAGVGVRDQSGSLWVRGAEIRSVGSARWLKGDLVARGEWRERRVVERVVVAESAKQGVDEADEGAGGAQGVRRAKRQHVVREQQIGVSCDEHLRAGEEHGLEHRSGVGHLRGAGVGGVLHGASASSNDCWMESASTSFLLALAAARRAPRARFWSRRGMPRLCWKSSVTASGSKRFLVAPAARMCLSRKSTASLSVSGRRRTRTVMRCASA